MATNGNPKVVMGNHPNRGKEGERIHEQHKATHGNPMINLERKNHPNREEEAP